MIYKPRYFILQELVPQDVYEKYGERLWSYFDPNILRAQDILRNHFGRCTVNDWLWGGEFSYRGYRPPSVTWCSDLSTHRLFKAFDSHFESATPDEVRQYIISTNGLGNIVKRIEDDVNWVHMDTLCAGSDELVIFKP